MATDQLETLPERRVRLERLLRDLEAGGGVVPSNEYPMEADASARQIDRIKQEIAEIDEALADA
jgi:predicted transcriptional regulator